MQKLKIEATDDTASVVMDREKGLFEISGRSLPEDSADFFAPILQWVSEYASAPNQETHFVFRLDYANTASSKFIHEILIILERVKGTRVTWWFAEDDEDMEEMGREFAEQVDLPFDVKMYEPETR